ncbi:MAG: ribose-phosphate pyrophosphokinase [Thermoprotei archaeon]|nr:MAG: ribose-phosphate pyrophosphokinase [Thermoprotei archaeon]
MALLLKLSGTPDQLARSLCKEIGCRIEVPHTKIFPDGEQYLRVEPHLFENESSIIIVQSMYPEQDRKWIELLLALEVVCSHFNGKVLVVIPYLAYARQDRRFLPGEALSLKSLLKSLCTWCIDGIITVDAHKPEIVKEYLEEQGVEYINILPFSYMATKGGVRDEIDFVLSPDKGALPRAKELATTISRPYGYLEKHRDRVTGDIVVEEKYLEVRGKTVVIVDDIISTGGTLARAVELIKKLGALRVIAIVTHSLLVGNAEEKFRNAHLDMLLTANTVDVRTKGLIDVRIVDVGPLVAQHLRKSALGRSFYE